MNHGNLKCLCSGFQTMGFVESPESLVTQAKPWVICCICKFEGNIQHVMTDTSRIASAVPPEKNKKKSLVSVSNYFAIFNVLVVGLRI